MANETDHLLSLLATDDGLAEAMRKVEASPVPRLVEIARALEGKSGPRFEALADQTEDQLALAPGGIDALLSLAVRERTARRARVIASRLGYAHTVDDFLVALEKAGEGARHRELFACWMHEVVLRGSSLSRDARATRFHERLAADGHVLGALPLDTLDTEREVVSYLPLYGDKGIGDAIAALESGPMSAHTVPPPEDGTTVRATKGALDEATKHALLAAVRPWTEGKKGKSEAKIFALEPPVDEKAMGRWLLRALALDSTAGVARLDVVGAKAEAVFGALFAAASNGGASSSGLGGAHGRHAAWASFGALVGANAQATTSEIEEIGRKTAFLTFRAPGPWFHDVAWDLGVLALREGGATASVLAATDGE